VCDKNSPPQRKRACMDSCAPQMFCHDDYGDEKFLLYNQIIPT